MRARLILAVAGGALIAGLALAPPAEASHGWSFGAGFHVGGVHFRVGFGPPGFRHFGAPFFVTKHRLAYRGHVCHGACFRRGGSFYHHAACPLVGLHFRRGGHFVGHYLDRFSPYRGHYGRRGGYLYRGYVRPWGYDVRVPYRYWAPRDRYRGAPRYRQHDYWWRFRDRDDDSDSDSDRRRRGRRRH